MGLVSLVSISVKSFLFSRYKIVKFRPVKQRLSGLGRLVKNGNDPLGFRKNCDFLNLMTKYNLHPDDPVTLESMVLVS